MVAIEWCNDCVFMIWCKTPTSRLSVYFTSFGGNRILLKSILTIDHGCNISKQIACLKPIKPVEEVSKIQNWNTIQLCRVSSSISFAVTAYCYIIYGQTLLGSQPTSFLFLIKEKFCNTTEELRPSDLLSFHRFRHSFILFYLQVNDDLALNSPQ